MDIEKQFKFKQNDIIVLGCSSGPDSMALLDMLIKLKEKNKLSIVCAHVNHNIREESKDEAEFLKTYCDDKKIIFEYMKINVMIKDNFHHESRKLRYAFFEDIVKKYNANYLMTAHHGDDLIESVMMKIIRGSNLRGYSGFQKITKKSSYDIIRPLICFTKEEILRYNSQHQVPYFIDSSNEDSKYTRNRYRKYILPFLKEEESNAHLKFLKFSEELSNAMKYIDSKKNEVINNLYIDHELNIEKFKNLDDYIKKEVLNYILSDYYGEYLYLLHDHHINLLLDLIFSSKASGTIHLPLNVVAIKSYDQFKLEKETLLDDYCIELDNSVELEHDYVIEKLTKDDMLDCSNHIIRLDSSEITLPIFVRNRQEGDRIYLKGTNGSKKIKDIFIDEKLTKKERDVYPIIVDYEGKILFIPGIKKSKFDKTKEETYDIIIKYSKRRKNCG